LTQQIGTLIAINLVLSFAMPGIDIAAHVGGLLAGAWLGLVMVPRGATLRSFWTPAPDAPRAFSGPSLLLQAAGVLAVVAIIVIGVAVGPMAGFA
jgi:hypothetical protein